MSDLISAAYARRRIAQSSFSAAESTLIDELIDAVSAAVEAYCWRHFNSESVDEELPGTDGTRLLLRRYPLLAVARVAGCPTAVLRVRNSSTSNQRATVAVTATGLTLVRVASGVA